MPHRIPLLYYLRMKRVFRRLARTAGTPEHIALGAAVGMFIGLTPTVGIQMALCVPVCLLLRANPLAAVPIVWISNPLTIIPIYSFNYWVGTLLVSGPDLPAFRAEFRAVIATLENAGVAEAVRQAVGMSVEILWPLWLGSVLVGIVAAGPTYIVTLRAVHRIRERVARRRRERHDRTRDIIDRRNGNAAANRSVAAPDE